MNYGAFASHRPDERYITKRCTAVIYEIIRPKNSASERMTDVVNVDHFGRATSCLMKIPKRYSPFVLYLLYRRFALASILYRDSELKIKPYTLWVTLAQNFVYVDRVWKALLEEVNAVQSIQEHWTSLAFDKYIVTETLVRRHEPVYVSQYRACRTNDMPNLSQAMANPEAIGRCAYSGHGWFY